jgi:hypothetical protein
MIKHGPISAALLAGLAPWRSHNFLPLIRLS